MKTLVVIPIFLSVAGNTGASLWTALAGGLGGLWVWRDLRGRKGEGVVLSVDQGRLRIEREGQADRVIGLKGLHQVRLDSKESSRDLTISRSDGVNSFFGMSSGHSISFDVARIEIVTSDESFLLSSEFISHTQCADEMNKIRRFLRSQGWTPIDERAPAAREKKKKG